jgi:hypothetical protein
MLLPRRKFLNLAATTTVSAVVASSLKNLTARAVTGKSFTTKGFGSLVKDPQGILDLPPGFKYKVFSRQGERMSDGNYVPGDHDGMAAFAGENGNIILVRNHELSNEENPGAIAPAEKMYDPLCKGGTTTIILDRELGLVKHYVSLGGTVRNCSGGATPWGSWLSCEEDVSIPANNQANNPKNVTRKHGYVFEVPAQGGIAEPVPLVSMGRFNHEAIVVDPQSNYIYQTEDREDGSLYRFLPKEPSNLRSGGTLEALVIKGMPTLDTSVNFPIGMPKPVEWVKIEEVDPERDTLRKEAQNKGAAIFKRGEGMCHSNGEIYWTCTSGGKAGKGQIFRYNTSANTVELFVESPGLEVLDYPDNVTITPFGHLMVCEDGWGEQFLVGINPKGECYRFARNALNQSELAGVCFAPDGKTMFVNIFKPGMTLAIWGPWDGVLG